MLGGMSVDVERVLSLEELVAGVADVARALKVPRLDVVPYVRASQ